MRRRRWTLARLLALAVATASFGAAAQMARQWIALSKDGVHDPKSPAITVLQQPGEALRTLPPDSVGNQVRWVDALQDGYINPRTNILPGTEVRVLETDILLNLKGGTPIVRFPHRQHTLWLDCSNCHDKLFKAQAGANTFSMERILQGEQCGVCHGAVAFPLTECKRCHSVTRDSAAGTR
jgi:c(7)-type cytochrome triheme protein